MAGIKSLKGKRDYSDDDYILISEQTSNTHPELDGMLLLLACLEFRWHASLVVRPCCGMFCIRD